MKTATIRLSAWDAKRREMHDDVGFHDNDTGRTIVPRRFNLGGAEPFPELDVIDGKMQKRGYLRRYMGVLDSSGREMREGDVVVLHGITNTFSGETEKLLCVVELRGHLPSYVEYYANEGESSTKFDSICDLIGYSDMDECATIVGDIYQNPELIEP